MAKHRKTGQLEDIDLNEPPMWWYVAVPTVLILIISLAAMA